MVKPALAIEKARVAYHVVVVNLVWDEDFGASWTFWKIFLMNMVIDFAAAWLADLESDVYVWNDEYLLHLVI